MTTHTVLSRGLVYAVLVAEHSTSYDFSKVTHLHPRMLRWQDRPERFATALSMRDTEYQAASEMHGKVAVKARRYINPYTLDVGYDYHSSSQLANTKANPL